MPYDTLAFLLDRANIEDVIRKIGVFIDERNYEGIYSDVFAEELWVDYSLVFNKPAGKVSARAQCDEWKSLVDQLDASQHSIGTIVTDLPQPGSGDPPTTVSVIAQYSVTLRRDAAPGETWSWNSGRFKYQVVRTNEEGNPWRVSSIKAIPVQQTGAANVYEGELQLKKPQVTVSERELVHQVIS